jgi:hypothetical protein
MLDAERTHAVSGDRAEPGEAGRVAVGDGDDAAMMRNAAEEPLDMADRVDEAALAGARRRRPAGIR